jgi:hypothetical protein
MTTGTDLELRLAGFFNSTNYYIGAIIVYLKCDIVVTGSPGFVSLCVFIFLTASSK